MTTAALMGDEPQSDRRARLRRAGFVALAVVFSAATAVYAALWIVSSHWTPAVELGFDNTPSLEVANVTEDSPAQAAGLRAGDRVVRIDGEPVHDLASLYRAYRPHRPGDSVLVTVVRQGEAAQLVLTASFRHRAFMPRREDVAQYFAGEIRALYPVPFVVIGIALLLMRPGNAQAWLLALMFASFAAAPGIPGRLASVPAAIRPYAAGYQAILVSLLGPAFYAFFALFPVRSPIDRRVPWLKWAGFATAAWFAVPGLSEGAMRPPAAVARSLSPALKDIPILIYAYGLIYLGLVSLALTYFRSGDSEVRRKVRVIFWGTVIAVTPATVRGFAVDFIRWKPAWWLETAYVCVLCVLPLSFAYAVAKHRVLDVPVLLKRSARYLMVQRGFLAVLAINSIALTGLFASLVEGYSHRLSPVPQPAAVAAGAMFGTLLMFSGIRVHRRVNARIDRAFFRGAYDTRVILSDLAERARTATDRAELAGLLRRHIEEALHPAFVDVYLPAADGMLAPGGESPAATLRISPKSPLMTELVRAGTARDIGRGAAETNRDPVLAAMGAECIAPMPGRGGELLGLVVVGPRRSEEPYSGEDKLLLTAVATQAGAALDNLQLAEGMAERMEADRRAEQEMQIAREVQARLLPQSAPRLATLDCSARCLQARSVGGDYYDFIRLDAEHLGLVLADVSGKGVHAALLMASLQAHLRNQSIATPLDPVLCARHVNRMVWESTAPHHYATMFYGIYDDRARTLSFVNCGHNPPLLLSRDGSLRRLDTTGTVIGLFEHIDCEPGEVQLSPGDLLVIFSDGVTEALRGDDEFGEERLVEELRRDCSMPVKDIAGAVFDRVVEFSAGTQSDDLTVVVARVLPRAGEEFTAAAASA